MNFCLNYIRAHSLSNLRREGKRSKGNRKIGIFAHVLLSYWMVGRSLFGAWVGKYGALLCILFMLIFREWENINMIESENVYTCCCLCSAYQRNIRETWWESKLSADRNRFLESAQVENTVGIIQSADLVGYFITWHFMKLIISRNTIKCTAFREY